MARGEAGRLPRLARALRAMVARYRNTQTPDEKNVTIMDEKKLIFHDGTVALWRAMGILGKSCL
jgi:hypothetical protein